MCFQVLHAHDPGVKTIDGAGGDEGIDAYKGEFENPSAIYQFKFFRNNFEKAQRREIKSSLETALKYRSGFEWILVCNRDPSPNAQRWFDKLQTLHPDIDLTFIFESELKSLLLAAPQVRKEYFPNESDFHKAVLSRSEYDPLQKINASVRAYNNILLDDRFSATITSDGNTETIVFVPKPEISNTIPLFELYPQNENAANALNALRREGKEFTLTPEDIKVIPRVDFLPSTQNFISLSARSNPEEKPSLLRLYSSDVRGEYVALAVALKTIREGEEVLVRSNADQESSPVIVELECSHLQQNDSNDASSFKWTLAPRYKGLSVKKAYQGAQFLAQLSKSHRLGISDIDGDFDDATFCSIGDMTNTTSWDRFAFLLNRVVLVCDFFHCNPAIDESINDPDSLNSIIAFSNQLLTAEKELKGSVAFDLVKPNKKMLLELNSHDESVFVLDQIWSGNIFGVECQATIRTTVRGKLSRTETDQGLRCIIKGSCMHAIKKMELTSS